MTRKRFTVLDSFRGIAALAVALMHLKINGYFLDSQAIVNFKLFVDFFFVLSGFVIAHSYFYNRSFKFGFFVKSRLARLYPLHLYTLMVMVAFEFLKFFIYDKGLVHFTNPPFTNGNTAGTFVENIFLLQSLNVGDGLSWNTPAWSISAEFYVNIAMAAVVLALGFSKKKYLVIAGIVTFLSWAFLYFMDGSLAVTYNFGWLRCLYGFGLGMLAYHFYRYLNVVLYKSGLAMNRPRLYFAADVIEIFLVVSGLFFICFCKASWQLFVPLWFVAVIVFFAFEAGVVSQFLKRPLAVLMGDYSYSIYLNHAIVAIIIQKLYVRLFESATMMNSLVTVAAYLAIVISYSALTYYFIERPGRRFLRNWTPRFLRTAVQAQSA